MVRKGLRNLRGENRMKKILIMIPAYNEEKNIERVVEELIADYARQAAAEFTYGTNMRGSAEYRQHLAEVLIRREMSSILAEGR